MTSPQTRPRIAIIGSGISGLAAAWLLGEQCRVTLFERHDVLGLGSQGHAVDTPNGSVRVDVPPRVFNAGHYQAMTALLADLDMPTYEISQSPSFTDPRGRAYLGFATAGSGNQTRSTLRRHPRTWRWLSRHGVELYRWRAFLQRFDSAELDPNETAAAALSRLGFSSAFRDSFLYPMWALMCTCRFEHLDAFPAAPLFELARNFAGDFATRRFKGGTRALEARLLGRVHAIELGRTVRAIEQYDDHVEVHTAQTAQAASFSHIIVATDPAGTEQLLREGPWASDRALIAQVPRHETCMVLHTDTTTLPSALRSPVNIHVDAKRRRSSATLWMNPIEHEPLGETLLQSWDPMTAPAPSSIKVERIFQRALMNLSSQKAMARLRTAMQNDPTRRVWYVGSYVADGVPLLENGVRSAQFVAGLLRERFAHERALQPARSA